MHPEIEEILAVRDGEAPPETAHHVATCPDCSAELDRLRSVRDALRALPSAEPERDLWPGTLERIESESGRWRAVALAAAAAAILFLSVTGAALLWKRPAPAPSGSTEALRPAGVAPVKGIPETTEENPPEISQDPELARLIRDSQNLELFLSHLNDRPAVVSGRRALAEMGIQDRLARVDARLGTASPAASGRSEQKGLWQERVKLLGALAEVKGAKRRVLDI